jgi:hypothetical protein
MFGGFLRAASAALYAHLIASMIMAVGAGLSRVIRVCYRRLLMIPLYQISPM